jgi:hypothetical protein
MKLFRLFALAALLGFASSCAMMFNEKTVDVSINSNPMGADVFINGKNYGKTPVTINIEPKNYIATVSKEGYGSAQVNLEYWVTVRNKNCVMDILGTMLVVPYYSYYWSGKCNDFKQKDYFVNIPNLGRGAGNIGGNSMIGAGQNPANMIDYYYNQDLMNNPYAKRNR